LIGHACERSAEAGAGGCAVAPGSAVSDEVGVVQYVEGLGAEFEAGVFVEAGFFDYGEVGVVEVGGAGSCKPRRA